MLPLYFGVAQLCKGRLSKETIVQGTFSKGQLSKETVVQGDYCPRRQLFKETIVQGDSCPRRLLSKETVTLFIVQGRGLMIKQSVLGLAWRYTELSVARTQLPLITVIDNCRTYKAHPQLREISVNKVTLKNTQIASPKAQNRSF